MSRALVPRFSSSTVCASCRARVVPSSTSIPQSRPFSATPGRFADDDGSSSSKGVNPKDNPFLKFGNDPFKSDPRSETRSPSATPKIGNLVNNAVSRGSKPSTTTTRSNDDLLSSVGGTDSWIRSSSGVDREMGRIEGLGRSISLMQDEPPHKLYIYAHKHNTHITLSAPPVEDKETKKMVQKSMISMSCGNIGFRKSGRGSYDAAYQLAGFVMAQIQHRGWEPSIKKLEIIFRGFGPGREAASKALLGLEGKNLKSKIVGVTDATRLKFGGTRSRAPRRLG